MNSHPPHGFPRVKLPLLTFLIACAATAQAHVIGNAQHDARMARFAREFGVSMFAQVASAGPSSVRAPAPAAMFEKFAPRVSVRTDGDFLWVESNGLAAAGNCGDGECRRQGAKGKGPPHRYSIV